MRMPKRGAAAVLPLLAALSLTACGADGGDDGAQVASAGGAATTASTPAAQQLSPEEMAVKFAECMRSHGVQMDDPVGPDGRISLNIKGTDKGKMQQAQQACRQYNPMTNKSGPQDPQAAERQQKFAECMRSNGVEQFPDPKPGQRGILINKEIGDDPDFKTAQEACQDILGGPRKRAGA